MDLVKGKVQDAGNLVERCNFTAAGSPSIARGVSFFTDLADSWVPTVGI